jgi:hypothetical protein
MNLSGDAIVRLNQTSLAPAIRQKNGDTPGVHMNHFNRLTTLISFFFSVAAAVAQTSSAAPTDAELRELISEPDRVVILLGTKDVYWAVKARSVGTISGATVDILAHTNTIILENKIVVIGGADRAPTKKDLLEAVRDNWYEPFEGKQTYWDLTGHKPAELIQIAKGQYGQPKKIEVKAIVTWWCAKEGPNCHNPKD